MICKKMFKVLNKFWNQFSIYYIYHCYKGVKMENFKLSEKFIDKYKRKKAPFGFNGLGELVYMRTYSRIKDNDGFVCWRFDNNYYKSSCKSAA